MADDRVNLTVSGRTPRRLERLGASALFLLAALGLLDAAVLLPVALAPSVPLVQVWADVAAIGDLPPVLAGPVVWALICAACAGGHLSGRRRSSAARVGARVLIEVGVLAVLEQVVTFGPALWLSNHEPPFEGGSTGLGTAMLLLGPVAVGAGTLMLVVTTMRRRSRAAASA